jgi:hypothetical protein
MQRLLTCIAIGATCRLNALQDSLAGPEKHFYAKKRLQPFGWNAIPKRSAGFTEKRRKENNEVPAASDAVLQGPPITIRRSSMNIEISAFVNY